MVPVLVLTHKRGGRCNLLMASPRSSVLRIRDSRISRRFRALYRQLTLRPARLITASASSNSLIQSSRSSPSHETTCQGATTPLRERTVTASPFACRCLATIRPRCPAPPGITTRRERCVGDSRRISVAHVFAVWSDISVHTEYTAISGACQGHRIPCSAYSASKSRDSGSYGRRSKQAILSGKPCQCADIQRAEVSPERRRCAVSS
jgi:hypothetical protein